MTWAGFGIASRLPGMLSVRPERLNPSLAGLAVPRVKIHAIAAGSQYVDFISESLSIGRTLSSHRA